MSNPNLIAKTYGSLREAFGVSITKVAKTNKKIVLLDGDLAGTDASFLKKYPVCSMWYCRAKYDFCFAGMQALGLYVCYFAVFAKGF